MATHKIEQVEIAVNILTNIFKAEGVIN